LLNNAIKSIYPIEATKVKLALLLFNESIFKSILLMRGKISVINVKC